MKLRPSVSKSAQRCAYCHDEEGALEACPSCGTLLHPECAVEGCPTLGCIRRHNVVLISQEALEDAQARRTREEARWREEADRRAREDRERWEREDRLALERRRIERRRQEEQRREDTAHWVTNPPRVRGVEDPERRRAAIARDARNMEPH